MRTFQEWSRRLFVTALSVGVTAGLGIMAAASAHAATAISNGSFETPMLAPNTANRVFVGQSIGAWTISQGNVDHIGTGLWQVADGGQSVDLNGGEAGGVAQTFTTAPGTRYKATYQVAGNVDAGPMVKTGQVLVNGDVLQEFKFDITGKTRTDMGYQEMRTEFVATGSSTTLELRSTTRFGHGPVIDNVIVEKATEKKRCWPPLLPIFCPC